MHFQANSEPSLIAFPLTAPHLRFHRNQNLEEAGIGFQHNFAVKAKICERHKYWERQQISPIVWEAKICAAKIR